MLSPPRLVRDLVPERMRRAGGEPETRIADRAEYSLLLRAALVAGASDLLGAVDDPDGEMDALADMTEVIRAIATDLGHKLPTVALESRIQERATEYGGFNDRIVLVRTRCAAATVRTADLVKAGLV